MNNRAEAPTIEGTLTEDGFLGGRIRLLQPRRGFRAAIDSVLLPAAVSTQNGLEILDAGIGAGVAALCLLARVPAFRVTGIEIDSELAGLAEENARRNGWRIDVRCSDLLSTDGMAVFDQVMTNPPYYSESGTPPRPERLRAQVLGRPLSHWLDACLDRLKPGGVLTLIHRADCQDEIVGALSARAGEICILPLVPKAGAPPSRIILRARLGGSGGARVLSPFVLHGGAEKYTAAAEAVLRQARSIDIGDDSAAAAS